MTLHVPVLNLGSCCPSLDTYRLPARGGQHLCATISVPALTRLWVAQDGVACTGPNKADASTSAAASNCSPS